MPHGISPPQSDPRSINCYSLLWYWSTSLAVSTATSPSYNISTLSYKLSSPFEWAPFSMNGLPPLLALLLISNGGTHRITRPTLTNIFFNQEPQTFSCIPDCPVTLMQDFYCRIKLLARNNTSKLSAPSGAHHQHTRVPYKLSDKLSSWLLPLLVLLISDGGTNCTVSTLTDTFFKKTLDICWCIYDSLATLRHLLPGQLRAADLLYKADSLFRLWLGITLIVVPTWYLPSDQLSSHME